MSDGIVQVDREYVVSQAEDGKFTWLDPQYLSTLDYPLTGDARGRYAVFTYQTNPTPLQLSASTISVDNVGIHDPDTLVTMDVVAYPTGTDAAATFVVDSNGNQIDDFGSTLLRLGPVQTLTSASSVQAGSAIDVSLFHNYTLHTYSDFATGGATIEIQSSLDNTHWATIATLVISNSGTDEVAISQQAYKYLRAEIVSYTSGTYDTYIYAGN